MGISLSLFRAFWNDIERKDANRVKSQNPPQDVEAVLDIPYIEDGTREHLLDVYFPHKSVEKGVKLPVIIDIHGGGWMYGYKEINKNYNYCLASSGYTVFSLNYRLVPDVYMADQLSDIFAALSFIDTNLENFPCDRNNIYLIGDSAGGQLAAYTAIIHGNNTLEKAFGVKGSGIHFNAAALISPVCDMDIGGFIGFYTKKMLGKGYKKKPYSKYLTLRSLLEVGWMPPCFLVSSSGDTVAKKVTKKAAGLIEESGTAFKFMYWKKDVDGKSLQHVFSVTEPEREESMKTICRMLQYFDEHKVSAADKAKDGSAVTPETVQK